MSFPPSLCPCHSAITFTSTPRSMGRVNWFRRFYSPEMSGRGARDDSVAHRHFENLFDARHVQIPGMRADAVTRNPKIDMRRLNFGDLREPAGGPMFFYPANDQRFP